MCNEPTTTSRLFQEKKTHQQQRKKMKIEVTRTAECVYHPPRVSVPFTQIQEHVTLNKLTELLQFAAFGKKIGVHQPSWCHLHHQKRVKGFNIVVLEGLTQSLFYKHFLTLQHLRTNYTTRLTFTPLGIDLPSGIFSSKVPESVSSYFDALRRHPVIRRFGTEVKGLSSYTLTQEEMVKRNFPVRGIEGFEDFSCTDSAEHVTDSSPLYGLDCEMCLTKKGSELTRISLVDSSGKCLLDELVKPPNHIVNYLTRFSGITSKMLRPINTTLNDVQTKLLSLLPRDAVLVGHSLENDLRALKLIHPHVIDTSLLYRKEFEQRFKLKVLAETVLGKRIQTQRGHDPVEDATAALELAQYFIKTGPRGVVELYLEDLWGESLAIYKTTAVEPTQSTSFVDVLQRSGQSIPFFHLTIDPSNQERQSSEREVLAYFRRQTEFPSFSVVQFSSFSDHLKNSCLQQEQHYQKLRAHLRLMCVVFAGPFPSTFCKKDVGRLFRSCGPLKRTRLLRTTHRTHAEIEFKLLEGALLAVKTLNGHSVNGQYIQVQRPVNESTLDLDLALDALMADPLNCNHLHVVKLKPNVYHTHNSQTANGHIADDNYSLLDNIKNNPIENGPSLNTYKSETAGSFGETLTHSAEQLHTPILSEKELNTVFGHFGVVEGILLPVKANGRCARHANIKFQSSEGVQAALRSSEEIQDQRYLICPSLTPYHLCSWASATSLVKEMDAEEATVEEEGNCLLENSSLDWEMEPMMRELDYSLRKLFKSLPDLTLSVVVLPGRITSLGRFPGLCFMEVKRGSL